MFVLMAFWVDRRVKYGDGDGDGEREDSDGTEGSEGLGLEVCEESRLISFWF